MPRPSFGARNGIVHLLSHDELIKFMNKHESLALKSAQGRHTPANFYWMSQCYPNVIYPQKIIKTQLEELMTVEL